MQSVVGPITNQLIVVSAPCYLICATQDYTIVVDDNCVIDHLVLGDLGSVAFEMVTLRASVILASYQLLSSS
jgi:hypothetical protein